MTKRWAVTIGSWALACCAVATMVRASEKSTAANGFVHGELLTYQHGESRYGALSLQLDGKAWRGERASSTAPRHVVILVDTSASQINLYRHDALACVDAVAAGLTADDQLFLIALDVQAEPLTEQFCA